MAYAITLRLDATSTLNVEAMWQALASRSVSDEALSPGYPPHLTLAVFASDANAERLLAAARECAAQWKVLPTTSASLGLFPGNAVNTVSGARCHIGVARAARRAADLPGWRAHRSAL